MQPTHRTAAKRPVAAADIAAALRFYCGATRPPPDPRRENATGQGGEFGADQSTADTPNSTPMTALAGVAL